MTANPFNLTSCAIDFPILNVKRQVYLQSILSGNFARVNELPPTACPLVVISLPPSLNGAYIRNGPNPQFFPRGRYHLFDGDGMLNSISISDGKAIFCSHFVRTHKYNTEREIGSPVIPNVVSAFNGLPASLERCAATLGLELLKLRPTVVRGNGSEIMAFFGFCPNESDFPDLPSKKLKRSLCKQSKRKVSLLGACSLSLRSLLYHVQC